MPNGRDCGGRKDEDLDPDPKIGGISPKDLLKWRWLCATGVFHASGNTLSVEALHRVNLGFVSCEWLQVARLALYVF